MVEVRRFEINTVSVPLLLSGFLFSGFPVECRFLEWCIDGLLGRWRVGKDVYSLVSIPRHPQRTARQDGIFY